MSLSWNGRQRSALLFFKLLFTKEIGSGSGLQPVWIIHPFGFRSVILYTSQRVVTSCLDRNQSNKSVSPSENMDIVHSWKAAKVNMKSLQWNSKLKQTGKVSYSFLCLTVCSCSLTQDNNKPVFALLCVPGSIHEEPSLIPFFFKCCQSFTSWLDLVYKTRTLTRLNFYETACFI